MKKQSGNPVVGIAAMSVPNDPWPPTRGARETYIHSVLAAGGAPLIIPPFGAHDPESVLRPVFDRCDALLLCGGVDIAASFYDEERSHLSNTPDLLRDHAEVTLTRWAFEEGKPILGVCRGCQMINVAMGGSLYQDIPTEYDAARVHAQGENEATLVLRHDVRIEPGSVLRRLIGREQFTVNSVHHQAIKSLAPGFAVSARAEDGIVEGVEHSTHPFAVGVQWHPELVWEEDRAHLAVFEGLVRSAGLQAGSQKR